MTIRIPSRKGNKSTKSTAMDVDVPESSTVQMDFSRYANMAVVNREPLPYSSTVASISDVHPHGLAPGFSVPTESTDHLAVPAGTTDHISDSTGTTQVSPTNPIGLSGPSDQAQVLVQDHDMVEAVDSTESFVPDQPPLFCRGNEQLVERLARGIAFHVKVDRLGTIIDSGASTWMTPDQPNLNYKLSSVEDSGFVKLADSSTLLPIKGYGDVVIDFGGHKHIIRNALHVPGLAETLGSVRSLIGNSNDRVIFERDAVMLEIANSDRSVRIGERRGDLYYLLDKTVSACKASG
ncbi:hypothetical protein HDU97_009563, partial [Phlyctochytrium planicorne]